MPRIFPPASTFTPVRNAASLAFPPERSIGTWPTPLKKVRIQNPLKPGVMKYSSLAKNVIGRLTINGRKIESMNELWLIAIMTGPSANVFQTRHLRAVEHAQKRAEEDVFEYPVQH
jgi:hypothetical protein